MAERGIYLCVVRQDSALPVVVHSSIRKNDEQGQQECMDLAWKFFQNSKGRVPFAVAEIHLSPSTQPSQKVDFGKKPEADRAPMYGGKDEDGM